MTMFPTDLVDRAPSRTSKLLGDTGTQNGNFAVQAILDLLQLADLPPGINAGDRMEWSGTAWGLVNDLTIGEMPAAAALGDLNQFALSQGAADPVRATMAALFTYVVAKLFAENASIQDVAAATTVYTFLNADKNRIKRFNASAAASIMVPAGFPVGYTVGWIQQGAGVLTFSSVLNAGQTIQSAAGLKSGGQFGKGVLQCVATNVWNLSGYTTA